MARINHMIKSGPDEGDAFIGLTDSNKIRIGYVGGFCVDSTHDAFARVAECAANMDMDELERACEWALAVCHGIGTCGEIE